MSSDLLEPTRAQSLASPDVSSDELTILAFLEEQGVRVFTPQATERFKGREKAKGLRRVMRGPRWMKRIGDFVFAVGVLCLFATIVGAVLSLPPTGLLQFCAGVLLSILVLLFGESLAGGSENWGKRITVEWKRMSLEDYVAKGGMLPNDAAELTETLASRYKGVRFSVDKLVARTSRLRLRDLDPILYAHHGDAGFAVAQWVGNNPNVKSLA